MARILVVDDRPTNRELLVTLLGYRNHELLEAADGADALAVVRAERPDLVICDILMPTMDGYEFVRRLRADATISSTQVIFCTAHYREREARKLAASCGVRHVLMKPVDPEEVLARVDEAITRAHAVRDSPPAVPDSFDVDHLRIITDKLSEQTHELQIAHQRLAALTELNLRLASERDTYAMLYGVCEGARDLISARYAALEVRHRNDRDHIFTTVSGVPGVETHAADWPDEGIGPLGPVTLQTRSRRVVNPGGDPREIDVPAPFPSARTALSVPIVSLRTAYGWLCVAEKVGEEQFTDEDEYLMSILGAQVGRIYESGALYMNLRRHASALEQEARARQRAQTVLATQYAVASILATTAETGHAIPAMLEAICRPFGFRVGAFRTVDRCREELHCVEVWTGPADDSIARFVSGMGAPVTWRDDDLAAHAWNAKVPRWVGEISPAQAVGRWNGAVGAGIRRAVAVPVAIAGEVVAVIEMYADDAQAEDSELVQALTAIGSQIGQFLDRKAQEANVARHKRIYALLSGVNALIVRVRTREDLFASACRIAVDAGEFTMAWICAPANGSGAPPVLASAHADSALARKHSPSMGTHLVRRVIETGLPAFDNDLGELPSGATPPGSLIALPLVRNGTTAAVVGLHARERDFFNTDELRLLRELAGDLSFSLENIVRSERLDRLVLYDVLTDLPNRSLFLDRLEKTMQEAARTSSTVGVLVCDIDRFHLINETFGRHAGDATLREFARRLTGFWPDPAHLGRIAADRFAGILMHVDQPTDVAHLIEHAMSTAMTPAFAMDGTHVTISVTSGVATFPVDARDADTLVANAETALERARDAGERYLFYETEMTARVAGALMLEQRLRTAIDREQFTLLYQPKVDVATRRITGLEALLRWRDPDVGVIPPARFVPMLEETGMILEVGAWAIRQAVTDGFALRDAGIPPPRIAVNVSPRQLQHARFVQTVRDALAPLGEGECWLDLEITEDLIMHDITGTIPKLLALREQGIEIAIDDFGTGHSSLAYLAMLPVSTLKIDQSFVQTMTHSHQSTAIVSTIISLAHALNLKVVAEGVETEHQAALLRIHGSHQMQGYLFSRPIELPAIESLLRRPDAS
ncbi:MAG: EAL domain-containing protein [Betaproteobacteria bacterium]|nr:EAL domain-containing protein [Betaproteobacteria bacterium]